MLTWARTGSFSQSLSADDLGYELSAFTGPVRLPLLTRQEDEGREKEMRSLLTEERRGRVEAGAVGVSCFQRPVEHSKDTPPPSPLLLSLPLYTQMFILPPLLSLLSSFYALLQR